MVLFNFFYTFYESYFFPGQTPVPPRSWLWILDLLHDPFWAIWLAEVTKSHQHHDRIRRQWNHVTDPVSLEYSRSYKGLFNSLAPGGFDYSLKLVNVKLITTIHFLSTFCEIAIRWMPQHVTDHKSTLVQVMAWYHQAASHYLSQCWPRSLSPYDVTRPQWVKLTLIATL